MAYFSYAGTLDTDLDRLRFHLGDTVDGAGPRPNDDNFSDAELGGLIAVEGSWQRAVAAGFEALASAWSRHVTFQAGMRTGSSQSDIAKQYAAQAADWRRRFGTPGTHIGGASRTTRQDAYSIDLDNVRR